MLFERRILAGCFPTAEQALAPLQLALPWSKNVEGVLSVPESRLIYRHGRGRQEIRYGVRITIEKKDGGFSPVLEMHRLSAREWIFIAVLWGYAGVMGVVAPVSLPFSIPFAALCSVLRLKAVCRHSEEALDVFSLAYEAQTGVIPR
jgi:hypothetical protein